MSDWHEMAQAHKRHLHSVPRMPPRKYEASDGAILAALVVMSIAFAVGVVCGVLLGRY